MSDYGSVLNLNLDFNYYYRIYSNIHTMMKDRNYLPKKEMLTEEKYMSKILGYIGETDDNPLDFLDKLTLIFTCENTELSTKTLIYFFILPVKISKPDIEHIHKIVQKKKIDKLILILREKITPKVSSILKTFSSQYFYEKTLVTNPLDHVLQPKYELLNENDKNKVLEKYKTDIKYFPGMFKDQPVSKWFDADINSMFKITRKNGEIYYRVVRENN